MKRFILVITAMILIAVCVSANTVPAPVVALPTLNQFDAGFLDHQPSNTTGTWSGTGWYCIEYHPWPGHNTIIAGPFQEYPNCNAY